MIFVNGIFDLIYYLRVWADFYSRGSLFEGIMKCVLGIFIFTHAEITTVSFSYVFSIYIIINGIICMETVIYMQRSFEVNCGKYVVLSYFVVLGEIIMMFFSLNTVKTAAIMTGIIFMGIVFTVVVNKSREALSVHTILKYTPENAILAAGILLLFFALKSLTVVFPLSILYLASGILFRPVIAVLISTARLAITITIPYWIRRYSRKQIVGFLPGDIVSIYFGACDTAYLIYFAAGVSGFLLSIITTTLLGEKISAPFSGEFMIVLLCRILVSLGAVVINYRLNQKKD